MCTVINHLNDGVRMAFRTKQTHHISNRPRKVHWQIERTSHKICKRIRYQTIANVNKLRLGIQLIHTFQWRSWFYWVFKSSVTVSVAGDFICPSFFQVLKIPNFRQCVWTFGFTTTVQYTYRSRTNTNHPVIGRKSREKGKCVG